MVGKEGIIQSASPGNLRQFRRIPAVAAQNRHRQTHFPSLFDDHAHFLVITRYEEHIRVSRFDFRQSRFKVRIFG